MPSLPRSKVMLTIYFTPERHQAIKMSATKKGISMTALFEKLVDDYFANDERFYRGNNQPEPRTKKPKTPVQRKDK